MKKLLKDRYVILATCFALFGVIMFWQLFNLQVIHGEDNYEKSQNRLLSDRSIPAPRGNIMDRYGVPLATSRQGYTVQIVKTHLKTPELNEMLLNLTKVLEKNGDNYTRGLARYLNTENGQIVYGTSLTKIESDAEKIEKLKKDIGIKDKYFNATNPQEIFEYFKGKMMFNISDKYSLEDAYRIATLRFELTIQGFTPQNTIALASDVSRETVAELEERHDDFPGVTTELMYLRRYNDAQLASHVVGYIRNIDSDTYNKKKDQGYKMTDLIGKAGVELAAESYLKGKDGLKSIEVDTVGRTTKQLSENAPIPGNDVILTIDTKLQKVALESLEKNINYIRSQADYKKNFGDAVAGTAVAIDVNNGEVLAMASYPGYDPAIYLEGAENRGAQDLVQQWISDEKNRPMRNRAIQDIYAPGSTYKPLVGIAGLEEGAIGRYEKINDTGKVNIGNKDFFCLEYRETGYFTHGPIALAKALETSCNIYFHELGDRLGIDKIDKWAKIFGLGEKTGLDIGAGVEEKGIRANPEYKAEWAPRINKWAEGLALKEGRKFTEDEKEKSAWFRADTAQVAIGQLFNTFTPLQLANYVSTLANGGKKYKPHVIKKVVKYDGSVVTETKPEFEQVPVNPATIEAVKEGMLAVAEGSEGTAQGLFDSLTYEGKKIKVAGKTGTAETGIANSSSNALFVCYAPADNPKIAVAVVIEKGVWGANSAPVAKDILEAYFNQNNMSTVNDTVKSEAVVFTR